MIYQKYIPKSPLDNYIESIFYVQGNNKGTGLPKTAMSLVFNLEDSFKLYTDESFTRHIDYRKYWVAGLQTSPTNVESYGLSKMLVVQFKTLGAFMFLKDPLHHYTNEFVSLNNVFGNETDEIWEQLQEAFSMNEQFRIIENFLYRKLMNKKQPQTKIICGMELLFDNKINLPINEICAQLNISRKHLNHLSKEYAGVSPKTLTSLKRLQTTLKTISSSSSTKLTHVAYQSEYFDQAHFINDFKRFTGLKPSEYAKLVNNKHPLKTIPHFIPFD